MDEFQPYRADPGTEFGFTDATGRQRTIKADERGLVLADDREEEAVLRGFDLPRAHPSEHDAGSPVVRKLTEQREAREKAEAAEADRLQREKEADEARLAKAQAAEERKAERGARRTEESEG